jgi:hypothetical protein
MEKNQNNQHCQQSDRKSNQPSSGKEREDPHKKPGISLPNNPPKNIPEEPDTDNDPTRPEPGVNEPEKNDPTRIDEPFPIFNNK